MNLPTCRCWLLGLLLGGSSLSGQVATPTGTLKVEKIDIRHIGPPAVSDDIVRANIRLKVGDPYTFTATDQDILALAATGYFLPTIRVAAERTATGVKLTYQVQGKPVLTEIRFEGNKKFSQKKLMKKVTAKVGEPLDGYKLFASAQEIQKMYQKAGFQKVKVEPKETVVESTGHGTVTFQITEGAKIRVVDVQFVGASAFSQAKLRRTIKTRRFWMFSWLTGGGKLKDDQFDEDKQKLLEFYQDAGYIDFDIQEVRFDEVSPTRLIIRFVIHEGRQYKVGKVEFKGNKVFSAEQIRKGVVVLGGPVRPRMLEGATFTPKGLDQDVEAVQDFYGAFGYIGKDDRSRIPLVANRNPNVENGTMDLVFEIEEGDKSFIEKVEIKGNTRTRDKVIRRELAVAPGEVFDMVRVKLSKERLLGLQFLSKVETEVDPTDVPNRKNLIVGVEEGSSGNFYMGAGFSSIESLFGYVGVTQGNFDLFNPPWFTGGGQKLRLQATVGTEQQNYELRFIEPWFLNQRLSLSFELFYRDLGYLSDVYTQTEAGGRIGLTKAIWGQALQAGTSYTLENIGIHFKEGSTSTNTIVTEGPGHGRTAIIQAPQISPELAQQAGNWLMSQAGFSLAYDRRGAGLLPSKGQRTELRTSVAGGALGGEVDFYKVELESAWYFRGLFEGHVLEAVARAGVVEAYGQSDFTFIWSRFYLGGAYTLRGFKFRDVGPKDSLDNPVGGNSMWMGSLEYSIPIIERLRFALFYDIGTVNSDSWDFNAKNYADDWGIGLRLNIPQMGPLRLDYGFPITHPPGTSGKSHFQFSVGFLRPI